MKHLFEKHLLEHFLKAPSDPARISQLLSLTGEACEPLRAAAYDCMKQNVGEDVYFRGLVEVTNRCGLNCLYCGIRRDNSVERYTLSEDDICGAAKVCAEMGFGSLVLQSGELRSDKYVDFICRVVERIKRETKNERLPMGLGITLSLGVFSQGQFQRMFDAGAHRYLLRIETSNEQLFGQIHPADQSLGERLDAIAMLQQVGFQTGTGVMIGLPGQTLAMLAQDVLMFKKLDIDMVGMGPFLPSRNTPMGENPILSASKRLQLGLNMIAVTRLVCGDINIASTTALEGLDPNGRQKGLLYGANVAMPNLTPPENRVNYKLYDDKPVMQPVDSAVASIEKIGRKVAINKFGDSRHFASRFARR